MYLFNAFIVITPLRLIKKFLNHEPLCEVGVASRDLVVVHACGQSLLAPHNDEQFFGPGDRRIDQVPLEKKVVLGKERQIDRRILAALALVHGYGVGMDDLVEI